MAEDVRGHLGVPEAGLVSEMDTGFQHLTHGDGHMEFLKVGSKIQPEIAAAVKGSDNTLVGWIRFSFR